MADRLDGGAAVARACRRAAATEPRDLSAYARRKLPPKLRSRDAPSWKTSGTATKKSPRVARGIARAGLDSFLPADGAFYLYADVSRFSTDSLRSRRECWRRRALRQPLASISIRCAASIFCVYVYAGTRGDMLEAVEADRELAEIERDRRGERGER